jgi:enolase
MTSTITTLNARSIFDSRGRPTVEVDIHLSCGTVGRAACPSGSSTGIFEAHEKRDTNKDLYNGQGVQDAIDHIHHDILPILQGQCPLNQTHIDTLMCRLDGTDQKSTLGANAILPVSLAVAVAAAKISGQPLYRYLGGLARLSGFPTPMMNVINGGCHSDSGLSIQEFMIVPSPRLDLPDQLHMGYQIQQSLRTLLIEQGHTTLVGDEGGFAPKLTNSTHALDLLMDACQKSNYTPGKDVFFALDCAASEFYDNGTYTVDGTDYTSETLLDLYAQWTEAYPIISLEDPFDQEDWDAWVAATQGLGCRLIGDDIFVTQTERLSQGIQMGAANGILIKPNQVGTLSETLQTIYHGQKSAYTTIISHRSGETEDTFISDLAVAVGADFIKIGALTRSDRCAKYNQLLRIWEECAG